MYLLDVLDILQQIFLAQFFDVKFFESEIEIENLILKLKFFETVLFPVYTTFFLSMETGVIFICKNVKFGLKTKTGFGQSHFRNLSACSIINVKSFESNPMEIA